MASSIIASIHSALDDLQLLPDIYSSLEVKRFKILIHKLRCLRTFLLCARKLAKDALLTTENNNDNKDRSMGSLLLRIEDAVSRNELEIHFYCLNLQDEVPLDIEDKITNFLIDIESFEEELNEWYITLSDYLQQSSSSSTNQVLDTANSILENLEDFLSFHRAYIGFLVEPIETLEKNIVFLKNFILFATLRSAKHGQFHGLLTHIESLAINAAHLTVHLFSATHYNIEAFSAHSRRSFSYDGMKFMISALLEKIKPADPHVYETYNQALANLKSSRLVHAPSLDMNDDPLIIMKDFIGFLQSNLWDMLQLDTCLAVSAKDQLQELYEGLIFLRTALKEQPNKFDDNIRDLTGAALCDAGAVIFSLYQKDIEVDLGLPDLLQNIKLIRAEVEEQALEISEVNFPRTNVLGFLDLLLDNLLEVKSCKVDSETQSCIQEIGYDLVFLRSFLGVLVVLQNQQEDLQVLWNRAVVVAHRIEPLVDHLVLGDVQDSFSMSFDSITESIGIIKTDALNIFHCRRPEIKLKKVTWTSSQVSLQSSDPATDEVVGLESETKAIIIRLTRGQKKLQVISIVGMPGVGKTTIAKRVYNDPSVQHHFDVRAWCSVSHVFNPKKMLLELLNHTRTKLPEGYLTMTEHDLAQVLRRSLKRRRYLIFLDDVWGVEAWDSLKTSFPDDSYQSRILVTSRHRDAIPQAMLDEEPHCLRQLSKEESWVLLQKKLFPDKAWPPTLYELGMQIVENCQGLPLSIVIVAGILSTTEQVDWMEVLKILSSGIISSADQCKNALELSYKHLPDHLKPCFLCFGAFPEGQEVSVKRLIWLWIAEGFVQKKKLRSLEEVATDYMMNLIGRSLVMVAKQRSTGGVKTCRTHDLLHAFCLRKAKEENFLQVLKGFQELSSFNEPGYLRRLCIYSNPRHFKESKLFCPRLRSLLFFDPKAWNERGPDISFIFRIFKLLNVLDIEHINLRFDFPSEIGLLVRLKYLAIQGTPNVSPSIGNLSNLETLILRSAGTSVILPGTIWNLQKLRHLYLSDVGDDFAGIDLPVDNLRESSNLYELDSLSALFSYYWYIMERQLRKFPNIRQLKCRLFEYGGDRGKGDKFMAFSFLSKLESLDVSFFKNFTQFEFVFPENLKKLTLSGCDLPWGNISAIGKLPNLEVLKLLHGSFRGNAWNVEEGEFPKLRYLKLDSLNIVRWTASEDQSLCLQKLVLESCHRLEEIPECLEEVLTLEMIEVVNCSDSIASLVEQIQNSQMDMGNSVLKIDVRSVEKDTW